MGQGQTYNPAAEPELPAAGGWILLTEPRVDRVHEWTRPWGDFDVIIRRVEGEWWEIEISDVLTSAHDMEPEPIYDAQASSARAAVQKARLWIFHQGRKDVAA